MSNDTPSTKGAHHIGLTVPNLEASRSFFVDTLGYQQLGEVADYPAVFLSDGHTMITLWQAMEPASAVPFNRHQNIGLHHLALAVESREQLTRLHHRLARDNQVRIEFAPEPLGAGPAQHMMCAIPGGIRVEFIAAG